METKLIAQCVTYQGQTLCLAVVTFMPDTEQQSARKKYVLVPPSQVTIALPFEAPAKLAIEEALYHER